MMIISARTSNRFPLLAAVIWRVLLSLHHAPYIDFVFQHELHISLRPEVAAFKFAIPFRVEAMLLAPIPAAHIQTFA